MLVEQHFQRNGSIVCEPLQHVIFLSGVYADTVERIKVAEWLAVAAYLACGYCIFQGVRCSGGTYFKGYQAPVVQDMLHGGTPMFARDKRLQLTDVYVSGLFC